MRGWIVRFAVTVIAGWNLIGTEDYIAYPNGLVWRRMTYQSLMPDKVEGYSWSPVDFFSLIPAGVPWQTLFLRDERGGDYHVASVLDACSDKRYDVYWADPGVGVHAFGCGKARRVGDAALLKEISRSRGFAMAMPFKEAFLFSVLGEAAGIPVESTRYNGKSTLDRAGG